jgi:two-component system, chemotaxis family, CheB/CheR fusion protein
VSPAVDPALEELLEFLKAGRGFDFTGYKRSTLQRRIEKRMQAAQVADYRSYTEYLELHPGEFDVLFNTILINVTQFFRDPETWESLRAGELPAMLAKLPADSPIRVWSAACASGEEPGTVAIILADLLGQDAFRRRVKIYATDVDDEALEQARAAVYSPKQVAAVPEDLRARSFEERADGLQLRPDLRRAIIFGRNDLARDSPISRVDLLMCRNTLMYFNAEAQAEILRRLHFALKPTGILLLGRSETLIRHGEMFEPLDMRSRAFRKIASGNVRERLRGLARDAHGPDDAGGTVALRDEAFDLAPGALIAIDAGGALVAANAEARALFKVGAADVGRPIQDLELSYRPVELRLHIEQVAADHRSVVLDELTTSAGGGEVAYEVLLSPVLGADDALLGTAIAFRDVTDRHVLKLELEHSRHELATAYEELQSTVEELETTNEELQSTNEELETTNEELQSTNEELETMNQELQSSNDELAAINDALRQRGIELDEVNEFMETILSSMGTAVAVVDTRGVVQIWNSHATELWGLRDDEAVGEHLLVLDIGLPVEELKAELRAALAGGEPRIEKVLRSTNRRGRPFDCRVALLPLSKGEEQAGAIVLMDDDPGEAA